MMRKRHCGGIGESPCCLFPTENTEARGSDKAIGRFEGFTESLHLNYVGRDPHPSVLDFLGLVLIIFIVIRGFNSR